MVTAVLVILIIGALVVVFQPTVRLLKRAIAFKVWKGAAFWLTGGILCAVFAFIGFAWGFLQNDHGSVVSKYSNKAEEDVYMDSKEHLRKSITEDDLASYFYRKAKAKACDPNAALLPPSRFGIPERLKQWKSQHVSCCLQKVTYKPTGLDLEKHRISDKVLGADFMPTQKSYKSSTGKQDSAVRD